MPVEERNQLPPTRLLANDLPWEQFLDEGVLTLRISGQCMQPTLADGAKVEVGRGPFWPGDILTVRRADGSLVTHRLLGYALSRRCQRSVVLCADETRRADPLVPLANVLGRVIAIDGAPYRPSPGTRFHAAAGWFRTAFQWCAGRCFPRRLRA